MIQWVTKHGVWQEMKLYSSVILLIGLPLLAQTSASVTEQAKQLEQQGDSLGARTLLTRAVQSSGDPAVLRTYAEFLDQRRDPAARAAYEKLLAALGRSGSAQQRAAVTRRLVVLSLLDGDQAAAATHVAAHRSAGGPEITVPLKKTIAPPSQYAVSIPGPLRSFARMAALSPDLTAEDLLPALARNVVTNGYQASSSNEALEQTEYMKLIVRYLSQARELEKMTAADKQIKLETCDSAQTGELLRVLGYRMRGGCGSDVVLETVNATRAFLTIDSGFPLAELEQSLRTNRPFVYDYRPTVVPALYSPEYWLDTKDKQQLTEASFIDAFLGDPSLCRLYLGLAKLDRETANELHDKIPVARIKAFAHVLDFYGGMFQIRNGKAIVPGGAKAHAAWQEFTGASPDQGALFFEKLIVRDDGWAASFYDSIARIHGPVRDYLIDQNRLKRIYTAIRGRITSPGPARPVFRANTDMLLLTTRLRLDPDGRPHIPGTMEVWKNLFVNHPHGKYDGKLTKSAVGWKEPDELIEALFALSRKSVENEPLKIYMALTDLNRHRRKPLEAATVDRLAREYRFYGSQYPIFSESPELKDSTILLFLDTAQAINKIGNQGVRADAAGLAQGLVGLWQIFVRQGALPHAEADATLAGILSPFAKATREPELFDAGRSGVKLLLQATQSPADLSPQDRLMDLLAGASQFNDDDTRTVLVQDMMRIFEAQRLISLKTIFDLDDNLEALSRGEKMDTALVNKLTARITEIQLPRSALSSVEKNTLAFGYWTEKHVDNQRKMNLRAQIERAGTDAQKMKDLRGLLAPVLRDTLVGFNYLHYAPPGAQVLQTNPLFVRTHDFLGVQGNQQTWKQTEVFGSGWPANAGGRLVGSLSSLPYALAEAEQNFLIPSREQALIWGDLVPQMILSAKIPRWWNVTPAQLRWVGLHMRQAETLVAEAMLDSKRRTEVLDVLDRQAPPARVSKVVLALDHGDLPAALEHITPAEMFLLAEDWLRTHNTETNAFTDEIRRLAQAAPDQCNHQAISRAFGTPKPTLANSYQPELLNLRTFPTLMGYSSRIMAETWESNLLYYAALADELHQTPSQLNVLIPEWTQATVERIFATHLEDWPALLRSLRLVGDDVRAKTRKAMEAAQKASLQ